MIIQNGIEIDEKQLEKEIEIYRTLVMESLTTRRPSKKVAMEIMKLFYKHIMNMPFPEKEFHVFDSPIQAWKWIQKNKCKNPNEEYVESYAIDISNAGYYHFYKFAVEQKYVECEKDLREKIDMAIDMTYFSKVFPFDDCCVVALNPIEMHFEDNVLHNENGASVVFADGFKFYNLNGVNVPEYAVMTKKEDFTKEMVLNEKNADVRREILRKLGNDLMIKLFEPKILDTWKDYELLEINIENLGRKYLKMINPSINTVHIEGVVNTVKTVKEALAWRNGLDVFVEPQALS